MGPEGNGLGPRGLGLLLTRYVLMCSDVWVFQLSRENGWNGSSVITEAELYDSNQ